MNRCIDSYFNRAALSVNNPINNTADVAASSSNSIQTQRSRPAKFGRGGFRLNSGRPLGSKNKKTIIKQRSSISTSASTSSTTPTDLTTNRVVNRKRSLSDVEPSLQCIESAWEEFDLENGQDLDTWQNTIRIPIEPQVLDSNDSLSPTEDFTEPDT